MLVRIMLAVFAIACWQLGAQRAQAAEPSEACLAPLPPGSADPVVRDVHFHPVGGGPLVSITACIASNHTLPLQSVGANIGIFNKDGVLLNYTGQSFANVLPMTNATANGPKLIQMLGVSVNVDTQYGQQFNANTVVAISSVACTTALPKCDAGPAQTTTLLLPVLVDQDNPKAK